MKSISPRVLLVSASLLTSLTLAGCASNNSTSSVHAASTTAATASEDTNRPRAGSLEIATLQQDVTDTRQALTRTVDALKRLPFAANPTESYIDFKEKFAAFEKLSNKTQFDAANLQKGSQKLVAQWQKWSASFQDPAAHAVADSRRVHLQDGYAYMIPTVVFATADLAKVTESLRGLSIALAPATTAAVLGTNQALIEKAEHQAVASADSLRNLSDRLELVAPDLAPPTVFTGKRPRS